MKHYLILLFLFLISCSSSLEKGVFPLFSGVYESFEIIDLGGGSEDVNNNIKIKIDKGVFQYNDSINYGVNYHLSRLALGVNSEGEVRRRPDSYFYGYSSKEVSETLNVSKGEKLIFQFEVHDQELWLIKSGFLMKFRKL